MIVSEPKGAVMKGEAMDYTVMKRGEDGRLAQVPGRFLILALDYDPDPHQLRLARETAQAYAEKVRKINPAVAEWITDTLVCVGYVDPPAQPKRRRRTKDVRGRG